MRRRVADHLRGALSNEEMRRQLVRGAVREEAEAPGFDAFAGLPVPKRSRRRDRPKPQARDRQKQALAKLTDEIAEARQALDDAEKRVRETTRERDSLAKKLEALEAKRDRAS
jgi:septal ring factor EnvC (AmiA/AmiB activator)